MKQNKMDATMKKQDIIWKRFFRFLGFDSWQSMTAMTP